MKTILFFVLAAMLCSCSNDGSSKSNLSDDNLKNKSNLNDSPNNNIINSDIPEFLKLIDDKSVGARTYLQGVERNDSAGPYISYNHYDDSLSFQLFYVPKNLNKSAITFDSVYTSRENDFKDYLLVSFVYPMKNSDVLPHGEDEVKYPLHISTYVRNDGIWKFVSESTANNLTELSRYQMRSIYALLNK